MAADRRANQVARRLIRPLPAQTRNGRRNRTTDVGRLIVIDRSVQNIGRAGNVFDDFPDAVPVTSCELDVIETYLSGPLDEASTGSTIGCDCGS